MARPVKNPTADTPVERKPRAVRMPRNKPSQDACAAIATFINIPINVLASDYALEPDEVKALANALYDAASSNPYIAIIINNLTSVGGVGELVAVVGAISAKRVAIYQQKHMPVDETGQQQRNPTAFGMAIASEVVIKSVASRATPITRRVYRVGQDDVSPTDSNVEEIHNSAIDQSGYSQMADVEIGQNGVEDKPRRQKRGAMDTEAKVSGFVFRDSPSI